VAFFVGVILLAGVALVEGAKRDKTCVAVVNGVAINREDVDRSVEQTKRRLVQMGQKLEGKALENVRGRILDTLIDRELLYQESQKEGITVSDAKVNEEVGALQKKFSNREEFLKALKKLKLTESDLKSQIKRQMAIKAFIDEKIASKVKITDEEAKAFYDKHPEYFRRPEEVRASHILVKVASDATKEKVAEAKKKIEAIRQRLEKGEDFAKVAKEVSEGPSAKKGGDLGFFKRGEMVKPFEDAAFGLKPGQTSDIVRTRYGFHIIKVTDRKPASTTEFKKVEGRIKTYLKQKKVQEEVRILIASLRKKAEIKKFSFKGK